MNSRSYQVYGIGKKCAVIELGDGWICAFSAESLSELKSVLVSRECPSRLYTLSPIRAFLGKDDTQSRIYFHPGSENEEGEGEALVVTPSYVPFKASASGRKKGDYRNFDEDGNPAPEILLLYALKTDAKHDRMSALCVLPLDCWEHELNLSLQDYMPSNPSISIVITAVRQLASDTKIFEKFVSRMKARVVSSPEHRDRWAAWDKIATNAFERKLSQDDKYAGDATPESDENLLIAARVETVDHGGLPSQAHVRKLWKDLNASDDKRAFENVDSNGPARALVRQQTKNKADENRDWRGARNRLGFDWLPTQLEWERVWPGVQSMIYGD